MEKKTATQVQQQIDKELQIAASYVAQIMVDINQETPLSYEQANSIAKVISHPVMALASEIAEQQQQVELLKAALGQHKGKTVDAIWHSPESTPEVKKNDKRTFWIAVEATYRSCSGDSAIGKVVFPAQYLNMPLEYDDEGELMNDDCLVNIDGDPVEAIGWHTERDHEEFDNYYPAIDFNDDYVLLGWTEYYTPSFTGVSQ